VHTQIRLAHRQGLLSGPRLSPVQHYAGLVLDAIEQIAEIKRNDRELRLALVSSGMVKDIGLLFDELKSESTEEAEDVEESTDFEGNPIHVVYDFSHAEKDLTPEEVEREVAMMLAQSASGNTSLDDVLPDYGEWV
jgi:hypothetical protein